MGPAQKSEGFPFNFGKILKVRVTQHCTFEINLLVLYKFVLFQLALILFYIILIILFGFCFHHASDTPRAPPAQVRTPCILEGSSLS